jgi:hypothetical protein
MKLKEVSVTCGRKVNLGNYQSATIEITLTASIEIADDDPDNASVTYDAENREINVLQTMARDAVHAEMLRLPRPDPGPSIARSGPPASAPAQPFQGAGSDPFC